LITLSSNKVIIAHQNTFVNTFFKKIIKNYFMPLTHI